MAQPRRADEARRRTSGILRGFLEHPETLPDPVEAVRQFAAPRAGAETARDSLLAMYLGQFAREK
jgi:hypothetical protein